MNKNSTILIIIFLVLLLSTCTNPYSSKFDGLLDELIQDNSSDLTYLIIPSTTCTSCSSYNYEIVRLLLNKPNIKIIYECYPNYYDALKDKLKEYHMYAHPQLHIDTLVKYQLPSNDVNSFTTAIIFTKQKKIAKVRFLNSNNPEVLNDLINKSKL